jgi:FtsH-binding integral membrane protein
VSTAWILLFLTQTSLVAARRTDLHRRLGIAGVVLAVSVLVIGFVTAVTAARNGVTPPGGPPPLAFLSVPLGTLFAFGLLAATGLYNRRRSETHRRLMLLATLAILTPAIARLRYLGFGGPPVAIGGTCAFVLVCFCYDRLAHGRIHPAFLWGGLLLMLSLPARFALGRTDAWLAFASWLTR